MRRVPAFASLAVGQAGANAIRPLPLRQGWSIVKVQGSRTFAEANQDKQQEGGKKDAPKAGPGFFETFRKSFREQMSRRTEEDVKFKEAREKVDEAKHNAELVAQKAMEAAQRAAEDAKKRADVIDQQTRPARDKIGEKVNAGLGVVGTMIGKLGENPVVKRTGQAAMTAAQAVLDAHDNIDRKSEELEKKLLDSTLGKTIRKTLGGEPQNTGPVIGTPIDAETQHIAVRTETAWERRLRKIRESTLIGPVFQTAENLAETASEMSDRIGDRVFGENETSICIGEIKRDDPYFNLQRFLDKLQSETIPFVLTNFLENRAEPLKSICTDRSMALLEAIIRDRREKGLTVDSNILDLEDVALSEGRMIEGEPVLIISFHTQQVHCVKNKKGEIVEGGEAHIQQIFYIWAMKRHFPEDPSLTPEWKLHEMAIQHQMYLLT